MLVADEQEDLPMLKKKEAAPNHMAAPLLLQLTGPQFISQKILVVRLSFAFTAP